jgi:predicted phage-related endonuclease
MQKKKLDLNNLLAKYEGYSSNSNQNSRYVEATREPQIEEEFYQYKTYQANELPPQQKVKEYSQTSQSFKGNFVMSKSEIEQFLLSIKDELRQEERGVAQHADVAVKQIHENFQRNHEKIKREILELLDRAFYENEKNIKEELAKQSKVEPPEFTAVFRRIHGVDEDINRLLNALKGNDSSIQETSTGKQLLRSLLEISTPR